MSLPPINEIEALKQRIENDFTYHAPKPGQPEHYQAIRAAGKAMALCLVDHCPRGRELSSALTWVELAVASANAGIARTFA